MRLIAFLLAVLSASPAAGQSLVELAKVEAARRQAVGRAPKVYTNADLKIVPGVPPPTVNPRAMYEQFLERQRAITPYYGPQDVVIGSPTAGPFGEFKPFDPPRRLDGTLLSDPPWYFSSYIGGPYGSYGGGYGSYGGRPYGSYGGRPNGSPGRPITRAPLPGGPQSTSPSGRGTPRRPARRPRLPRQTS